MKFGKHVDAQNQTGGLIPKNTLASDTAMVLQRGVYQLLKQPTDSDASREFSSPGPDETRLCRAKELCPASFSGVRKAFGCDEMEHRAVLGIDSNASVQLHARFAPPVPPYQT